MKVIKENIAEILLLIGVILILSVLYSFDFKLGVLCSGFLFTGAGIYIGTRPTY